MKITRDQVIARGCDVAKLAMDRLADDERGARDRGYHAYADELSKLRVGIETQMVMFVDRLMGMPE